MGEETLNLLIQREPSDEHRTFGQLFIDGQYFCETLEDVVREVKIKGETAIPAGSYRITMENSPRFGRNTITIKDVPGFTGVRIHAGNTEGDTEGCPLVGQIRADASILKSKAALDELKPEIINALQAGEQVWLEIRNG